MWYYHVRRDISHHIQKRSQLAPYAFPRWHPLIFFQAISYVSVKASPLSSVATKSMSKTGKWKPKQSLSTAKKIFNTLIFLPKVTTTLRSPFCGWLENWLEINLWNLLQVLLWHRLKFKSMLLWWMLILKNWNRLKICLCLVFPFSFGCSWLVLDEDDADL